MKPAVLIIGGAEVGACKVQWARECGLATVVADRDPGAPGMVQADFVIVADRTDECRIAAEAITLLDRVEIRGVYCGIDLGVKPTVIAHALGLDAVSLRAATLSQHKWLMKRQWMEDGIPTPEACLCGSIGEARTAVKRWGWPVIVKAPSSSGSRGIARVDDDASLAVAYDDACRVAQGGLVVVERCITGAMHDVNGLFWNGVFHPCGIMDRYFSKEYPCMSAYTFDPTELNPDRQAAIYRLLEAGARSLGISEGPVKADLVWAEEGPMLLGVAPRFHGDIQTAQTSVEGPGINVFKAWFHALAHGRVATEFLERRGAGCAAWKILPAEPGEFVGIDGLDAARGLPGLSNVFTYRTPGQRIGRLTDNAQIPAVAVLRGQSRAEVEAHFARVLTTISVRTRRV